MLLALNSTIFPKDFLALVFFMFSPNARDVKTLSAALFSFDPECFTCFNPSEISDARALRVFISFCSSGVFTTPQFASIFLVFGLFASVSMTSAFFLGLTPHLQSMPLLRFFLLGQPFFVVFFCGIFKLFLLFVLLFSSFYSAALFERFLSFLSPLISAPFSLHQSLFVQPALTTLRLLVCVP